jgi:predicted TPR repeat methyltransferase
MPKDPLQIALEHHRGGRYVQAEVGYRGVLAQNPNDAEASHWLGVLLFQAGQPEPAMRLLQHAASIRPQDAAFQFNLGRALHDCKRDDEAIAVFERAVELDPQPYVLLGAATPYLSRRKQGDVERAIELLRRAQSAGLDSGELYQHLGLALLLVGQVDQAVEASFTATEKLPGSADAQYQVAAALTARNDATLAAVFLGRALELDPDNVRALFALAMLQVSANKLTEAEALLRIAQSIEPNNPAIYQALAQVLEAAGDRQTAAQALVAAEAVLIRKPAPPTALSASEAIANFQQRLERSPDAMKLHLLLAVKAGVAPPAELPPGSVSGLFDRYAEGFDAHLRDRLQYRVPDQIAQRVVQLGISRPDVLDLGCGTGLCGEALVRIAKSLHGVDASTEMIARARSRIVYNQLDIGDMVEIMRKHPCAYDVIVAGDVLVYIGDLTPTFEAATASLRPGGHFIFSIEVGAIERFQMDVKTRRFIHAEGYVRHLADIFGFAVVSIDPITIRLESRQPVKGALVTLKAAANSAAS